MRLALPLVLSTASWALMHFVDRLFLFWYSPQATGAALASGTLLWTAMSLPLGIASYVNTFVAQYYGSGNHRRIGRVLFQGLLFGWFTVPLFLAAIPLAGPLFRWLGHDTNLAQLEAVYLEVNCWGVGGAVLGAAYAAFYTGRGQTWVVMVIDVAASVVNLVLDYAWIFGAWGFPEMGIAGAGWATVVAQWMKVMIYWCLLRSPALRDAYGLDSEARFDRGLLARLFRFGGPNGFQMMLEGFAFTVFVIYVARLGTLASAATTLAISVNIVAFVPMMGVGIAVSTLVGQQLGANRPELAARAVWSGLWLALAYNAVFAVLYVATPQVFLLAHAAGGIQEEVLPVRELAILLLRFVAAYCLFDAMQLTLCSAMKGAGDTRFVMLVSVVTSAAAIALIEWGMSYRHWGVLWCWTVLMLWVFSLALAYGARFLQGRWTTMRVIEDELA